MLPTALGLIWTPHLEHAFVRAIEAEEKEEEEEDDDDEEEDDDDDFFCFLLAAQLWQRLGVLKASGRP